MRVPWCVKRPASRPAVGFWRNHQRQPVVLHYRSRASDSKNISILSFPFIFHSRVLSLSLSLFASCREAFQIVHTADKQPVDVR